MKQLSVVGTIEPGSLVTVVAPFDGAVRNKYFEYGDKVTPSHVLMEMDSSELDMKTREAQVNAMKLSRSLHDLEVWTSGHEVSQSKRSVLTAQLASDDAQRKVAETKSLLDSGIVPKMEYETSVQQAQTQALQLATAKEDLERTMQKGSPENRQIARLEWESARKKLADLSIEGQEKSIRSPVAGVILPAPASGNASTRAIPIKAGTRFTKGQTMFVIANLETLAVTAKVDEIDVNQLHEGQKVNITGDAFPSFPVQGFLSRISTQALPAAASSKSASFELTVDIPKLTDDQRKHIRTGMSARLSIVLHEDKDAIVLPATAIHEEGDMKFVWMKDLNNEKLTKAKISIGDATDSGVQVLQGVREGDLVQIKKK